MSHTVKHTPGPWVAASHPSSIVGWPIVAQTGRLICSLATPPKDINRVGAAKIEYDEFMAECGANARLIAAAPELLAALKETLAFARALEKQGGKGTGGRRGGSIFAKANAAIAKAEGQQE